MPKNTELKRAPGRPDEGKKPYLVTLTETNAEQAKELEKNFSGLLDGLLSKWLKRHASNIPQ